MAIRNDLPIKVLHLISSRGLYGAERVIINIIASSNRKLVVPSLGLLQASNLGSEELHEAIREKEGVVYTIPCHKWIDIKAIKLLTKLLETETIDIIHCHGMKARLYGLFVSMFTNVKIITTHHNWTKSDFRTSIFEIIDAFYIRFFSKIIAVSSDVAKTLTRLLISQEKIEVIINGIDTDEFQINTIEREKLRRELGIEKDCIFIGTFGRMSHEKGQKYFIEACLLISQANQNTRFIIVGDGPKEQELKNYAKEIGIINKILFVGFQKNMQKFYSAIDIFVLPSLIEGTSMVLLEAMSCGIPVIATGVGGNLSVIDNGVDGMIVPPMKSDELSNTILRIMNDKNYQFFLSKNSRDKIVRYYSSKKMADKYSDVYLEIL